MYQKQVVAATIHIPCAYKDTCGIAWDKKSSYKYIIPNIEENTAKFVYLIIMMS